MDSITAAAFLFVLSFILLLVQIYLKDKPKACIYLLNCHANIMCNFLLNNSTGHLTPPSPMPNPPNTDLPKCLHGTFVS